jgi:hypothetical protein
MNNAMTETVTLEAFLADKCEATKAKYAAEMENSSAAWSKPVDPWYAESLVYFGLLERLVKPVTRNGRLAGSRMWFRKAQGCSIGLCKYSYTQTEVTA